MPGTLLVNKIGAATGTEISFETGHSMAFTTTQFKLTGGTAGQAITTDGSGNLTFADMTSDPTMGGDLSGTASNAQIVAGAVGTTEIATDAITANEIAAGAVGSSEIAADAVGSNEIAADAVGSNEIAAGAVGSNEIASTIDLSSKTITLPAASVTAHTQADTINLETDIALLAFKVAANGSMAAYNLQDQTIDAFEDTSGVDASASTSEIRSSSGKYYMGGAAGTVTGGTITTVGDNTVHTFTASGSNFVTDVAGTVDYLVLAGGGGGGGTDSATSRAGGGGAGGFRTGTGFAVAIGTYGVTVGT